MAMILLPGQWLQSLGAHTIGTAGATILVP
jgi:hypothetical protein